MLETGFIKLHRKMTKWGWYHDANTFRVFIHLLLTANYERDSFENRIVERGQRITSVSKLSHELKMSARSIRTALEHLKATNELTIQTTPKYTIITINNYNEYQQATNKTTNDRQTTDKLGASNTIQNVQNLTNKSTNSKTPIFLINTQKNGSDIFQATNKTTNDRQTTDKQNGKNRQQCKNKESKKDKEERETRVRTRDPRTTHGEFQNVFLSDSELSELRTRFPNFYEAKIERLSRYLASTGKTYRDHYATLLSWLQEDAAQEQPKSKSSYDLNELEKIDTLDWIE